MKNDFEKILNSASEVKLTQQEKENIRSAVFSRIKSDSQSRESLRSDYSWFIFLSRHTTAAFVLIIMFVGGGTSAIAQKSLPGEVLYGVKTSLNENISGWFVKSIKGEAEWELELAERRLLEADLLAEENKLTQERKIVLKKKFEEHTKIVEKYVPSESVAEEFSQNAEVSFSTEMVEMDQMSLRSVETSLAVIPDEKLSSKIAPASFSNEDFSSQKEEILEKIGEIKKFIDEKKITRERAIQVRLKLLKARELTVDLGEEGSIKEENIDKARNFLEEAETLLEMRQNNLERNGF